MFNKFCSFIAVILFAATAQAQVTPLIFERENIRIESPPARNPSDYKEVPVALSHVPLSFDTEIRPEDALRLEYIHTLNNLTDTSAVMIAFTAPSVVPLPAMQVPTAVDALFVTSDGTITQILPNVVLADLTQEIVAKAPVKAFLFLKAGTVAAKAIQPGDTVIGKRFAAKPPILQ